MIARTMSLPALTSREREIGRLLATGVRNKKIAALLYISERNRGAV